MPYRITLECPIDGTQLTNNAVCTLRGGPASITDEHKHINMPNQTMTCSNGHQWRFDPEETLQLNRVF